MNYLINILPLLYFFIIVFYLWKKNPLKNYGIKSYWSISIFTVKVIAGTFLWAIYTQYYTERSTADNFRFFDDAKIMHEALFTDPMSYFKMLIGYNVDDPALQKYILRMFNWDKEYNYFLYNDGRTMLRFNTICMLFSFGNYHVHTLIMSMFSLIGCFCLFKAFYKFLFDKKYLLLMAVCYIPSVLFYSSGVLKEGILMTGIGLFFYAIFNLKTEFRKPKYWIFLLIGIFILLIMKIYILLCLIPALIYFGVSSRVLKTKPFILFLLFNIFVFAGLYLLSNISTYTDIFYKLYKKKDDMTNVAMQYDVGSFIATPDLLPTAGGFLLYIPFAVYTVLMRPYLWETGSVLVKFAAIENILLLACMILPLFTWKKISNEEKRIIYFLFIFIFYLYILIGVTTPILGALSRYKVPALPFVLIICLFFIDISKLKKLIPCKHL